jgi:hypothetical protein
VVTPGPDGAPVPSGPVPGRVDGASLAVARRVLATGRPEEHADLEGAGPAWCRPTPAGRDGRPRAAVLVWPTTTVLPTLNQAQHLDRAVAVIDLALTRDEALAELERAATHDDLTGPSTGPPSTAAGPGRPPPAPPCSTSTSTASSRSTTRWATTPATPCW